MPVTSPANAPKAERPQPPRRGGRGEILVVLQVVLVAAFLFAPPWNPWLTPDFLALSQTPRLAVLAVCLVLALVIGGLGVLKLGANLTKLSNEQAAYIGVAPEGPFKPEHYRY